MWVEIAALLAAVYLVWRFLRMVEAEQPQRKSEAVIILDMNTLLLFRTFAPSIREECPAALPYIQDAQQLGKHYVWLRPHALAFAEHLLDNYRVAVWSRCARAARTVFCVLTYASVRARTM